MMIITIIITKITMMIRGETGGTHPHSSPVIRRPSKLSWHLTERTVTLCLQCHTVSHFAQRSFTIPLHTEHYSLHKTCFWHLTERSVTLSSKACTVHTAGCTQNTENKKTFILPKIRWWNAQHTWQLSNCCFTKNKYIFNTGWQDDALLHSWEHYI